MEVVVKSVKGVVVKSVKGDLHPRRKTGRRLSGIKLTTVMVRLTSYLMDTPCRSVESLGRN